MLLTVAINQEIWCAALNLAHAEIWNNLLELDDVTQHADENFADEIRCKSFFPIITHAYTDPDGFSDGRIWAAI